MRGPKWWYWTNEPGWDGSRGPWGPFEAATREHAERKADALARSADARTLDRVQVADLGAPIPRDPAPEPAARGEGS